MTSFLAPRILFSFADCFFGNLMAGQLGELCGRKRPLFFAVLLVTAFNVAGFFANSWISLAVCRFFIGAGHGACMTIRITLRIFSRRVEIMNYRLSTLGHRGSIVLERYSELHSFGSSTVPGHLRINICVFPECQSIPIYNLSSHFPKCISCLKFVVGCQILIY